MMSVVADKRSSSTHERPTSPVAPEWDVEALLAVAGLFSDVEVETLRPLTTTAKTKVYDADELVLHRRTHPKTVTLVVRGRVAIFGPNGPRRTLIGLLEGTFLLGAEDFAGSIDESFIVRAAERCVCLDLDLRSLERVLAAHPALTIQLLREACARQSRMRSLQQFMTFESIDEQLLRLLWDIERPAREHDIGFAKFKMSQLSRALGVDSKAVARCLTRLVQRGVVEVREGTVSCVTDHRVGLAARMWRNGPGWWLTDAPPAARTLAYDAQIAETTDRHEGGPLGALDRHRTMPGSRGRRKKLAS